MFWDIFFRLCKNNNEKPNNVGKKINVSSGVITKWKQGSLPNTEALIKLSDYFSVSIDYLLDRSDIPNFTNSISNTNTTVTGTQANIINGAEQLDEMTAELVKAFRSLPFRDRLDVINMVMEKSGK